MKMKRERDIFDEDHCESISLDRVIDELKHEDDRCLFANSLEKSIASVRSLSSHNSRALVLDELIDVLLEHDLVYIGKCFADEALDSAYDVEIKSEKAKTLSKLSTTFSRHGFDNISRSISESVLMETDGLEDEKTKAEVFISIAEDKIDHDLLDEARNILERARSAALRLAQNGGDIVYLALVAELKARIDGEGAEELNNEVLHFLRDPETREKNAWVICLAAKTFLRLGRYEEAMRLAHDLKQNEGTDIHMMEFGIALSQEGRSEDAVEIAGEIMKDDLRYPLIRVIATDLIQEGFIDDALKLNENIQDSFEKALVYKELVERSLKKGDQHRAYEYLDMIDDMDIKALAHKEMCMLYQQEGNDDKAADHLSKAREIVERSEKDSIKLELVDAMMQLKQEDAALDITERISTTVEKAIALGIIAGHSA